MSNVKSMPIYIATSNSGKLRDFAGAAALFGVEVRPLPGFSQMQEPVEDGATFAANAIKKAEHYSRLAPGKLVLADDSGLEVFALGGAPGVRSARYAADAGETSSSHRQSTDHANNARLLRELAKISDAKPDARFVCVLAVAKNGRAIQTFEGDVHGTIIGKPRGNNGFGYDPLFFVPELGKTTAELSPRQKAAISHRGRAFKKFLEWHGQHPAAGQ